MNREVFLKQMGVLKGYPDLVNITKVAYEDSEQKLYQNDLDDAQDRHRTTSFFASEFPMQPRPCARKALYSLMDVPQSAPNSIFMRGVVEIGKAVEEQIVDRWIDAGIMLSNNQGNKKQIRFEDNETWLSGAADAILDLRPSLNTVVPVDIKSKTTKVLDEMIAGERSYDEKHYAQVQAYIFLCRKYHIEMGWEDIGLKPAESGYIFYASREEPTKTFQFFIEADYTLINNGINTLKDWKANFLSGDLPERPKGWMWGLEPCKWCSYKRDVCKPDYKAGVTRLEDSHAIEYTKNLRKNYDPEKTKERVVERWN